MAADMAAASLGGLGLAEPKSALNHLCQRFLRRPVAKEDIVYTSENHDGVYQSTVTLNCMEGQIFVGETSEIQKDAEKKAAQQALMALEPMADTLPPSTSANKNKKRKLDGMMGEMATTSAKCPDTLTAKVILNTVCMKIVKRPMQKGEIQFETLQTPVGFQSTVRLPFLPGDLGQATWAGEVSVQAKQAEHNAAKQALEAIREEAGQLGISAIPQPGSVPAAKLPKTPKGKKPRTRITEVAITGEVLEWKGTFGWLKPHVEIQHEKAKLRDGKIFLYGGDLQGEVKTAEVGALLQFHLYEDPTGLGAEEAQAF